MLQRRRPRQRPRRRPKHRGLGARPADGGVGTGIRTTMAGTIGPGVVDDSAGTVPASELGVQVPIFLLSIFRLLLQTAGLQPTRWGAPICCRHRYLYHLYLLSLRIPLRTLHPCPSLLCRFQQRKLLNTRHGFRTKEDRPQSTGGSGPGDLQRVNYGWKNVRMSMGEAGVTR